MVDCSYQSTVPLRCCMARTTTNFWSCLWITWNFQITQVWGINIPKPKTVDLTLWFQSLTVIHGRKWGKVHAHLLRSCLFDKMTWKSLRWLMLIQIQIIIGKIVLLMLFLCPTSSFMYFHNLLPGTHLKFLQWFMANIGRWKSKWSKIDKVQHNFKSGIWHTYFVIHGSVHPLFPSSVISLCPGRDPCPCY